MHLRYFCGLMLVLAFNNSTLVAKGRNVIFSFSSPYNQMPGEDELRFSNRDSLRIKKFFESRGWESIHYTNASKKDLKEGLIKIKKMELDEDDQLIVYFSGHGKRLDKQYLLLADTSPHNLDNLHSVEGIAGIMDGLRTARKALILSSCNSGNDRIPNLKGGSTDGSTYNFAIISASQPDGAAYESDELEGCIFTHFLLKSMEDSNVDSLVEAYQISSPQFDEWVSAHNKANAEIPENIINQLPNVSIRMVGVSKILITRNQSNRGNFFPDPVKRVGGIGTASSKGVGSKFDVDGVVRVMVRRADGRLISRLVKIEKNKDYDFNALMKMKEPDTSLTGGLGVVSINGNTVPEVHLTHKYQLDIFRSYLRVSRGMHNFTITEFDRKFNDEQYIYTLNAGMEYPCLLNTIGTRDIFFNMRSFASLLYSYEILDSMYFKDGYAFDFMGGLGFGVGLSVQHGNSELFIDSNLSGNMSDQHKIWTASISVGAGILW